MRFPGIRHTRLQWWHRLSSLCGRRLYIPKVHTGFLLASNWWQQNFRQGQMQEDLAMMAQYMRDEFKTAFANDPSHHFQVVEAPQPDSLILELALTELVPSNVALSVLEYAPLISRPSPGMPTAGRSSRSGPDSL